MAGGKGGSSTTEVTVPEYIEEAARRNLNKAEGISQIGYTPYYGPDVAAFTPMQEAAFQNTASTAGAFGLAGGNMSARDIMGGMDAPTNYAGGVRGYSSAPMYEQSLEELGRQRPGQKNYIDSFFIDPVTGAAGSNVQPMIDYTDFETMAESGRRAEAAEREAAEREAADRTTYEAPGNNVSSRGDRTTSFSTPRSYLPGGVNTRNPESNFNTAIANLAQPQGPPTARSRPVARPADLKVVDTTEEADGETKVICTALHDLGRLSDEVYALDAQFGLRVNKEDPMLGDGYRLWATPVANYIKGDSLGSKAALAIVAPIATAWAAQMAHVMRPDEYKSNFAGRVLMAVGHPLCRVIGRVFLPQMNKEAV